MSEVPSEEPFFLRDREIDFSLAYLVNNEGVDPYHLIVQTLPYWLSQAEHAADLLGVSYRDFLVGGVGIAYDEIHHKIGIFHGGNNSPYQGADKDCAEKTILEKIAQHGYPNLIAMFVAGPVQPDQESGLVTNTLHPCGVCRENHRDHPSVSMDRTIVVTVDVDTKNYEVHTIGEIDKRHMTAGLQSANTLEDHDAFYVDGSDNQAYWERRRRSYGEFLFRLNGFDRRVDSMDDKVNAALYALRGFPRTTP